MFGYELSQRRRRRHRSGRSYRRRNRGRVAVIVALLVFCLGSATIIESGACEKGNISKWNSLLSAKLNSNIVKVIDDTNIEQYIREIEKLEQVKQDQVKQDQDQVKQELTNQEKENQDKLEKDDFSDAVFIGDSRTEGLQINTQLSTARFLAARGLKVDTALTKPVIRLKNGEKGTVIDGLRGEDYRRVYIMFGLNELGWPYLDVFINHYEKLLDKIHEILPNATIYVQSILPVSKEKSDNSDIYKNEKITRFNQAIKDMAQSKGYTYLDVTQIFKDSNGALPSDASVDGVHLNKEYSVRWLEYLRQV